MQPAPVVVRSLVTTFCPTTGCGSHNQVNRSPCFCPTRGTIPSVPKAVDVPLFLVMAIDDMLEAKGAM